MKKLWIICAVFIAWSCGSSKESSKIPETIISDFTQTITIEGLKADLSVIADDSLAGRETGEEGLEKAARYLKMRYKELGISSPEGAEDYQQFYDLDAPIANGYHYRLTNGSGEVIEESDYNKEGYESFITVFGGSSPQSGDIVYAGSGIVNAEEGINQLPDDVSGKWLMVFYDQNFSNFRAIQSKVVQGGAAGVILISTDESFFEEQAMNGKTGFGSPGRLSLSYRNNGQQRTVPAFNAVSADMAARLLGVDNTAGLARLSTESLENAAAFTPQELDYSLEHEAKIEQQKVTVSNVVAFLEGSDPELKDEIVVISSHYDHVGIGAPDSTGDAIYNGADDDGSGTVALLSVAQAMITAKNSGAGPDRSILFLHVSGEEKGLLGSRYYSDHPLYPIDKTVANVNVDMIGRVDKEHADNEDYVYIIGAKIISSGLDSLIRVANTASVNLDLSERYNDLNDPQQFYRRSDHWNFGRLGIPFVFFFNGVHEDYHRPSDEVDKIEWNALLKRTQLIYMTTAMLANASENPEVDNQEFIEATRANSR